MRTCWPGRTGCAPGSSTARCRRISARNCSSASNRIAGTDGVVAVRACAVAAADGGGEDGGTDPFAGLSDSFLNVRRDELLSRVAACWASGYSDRAVRYRMRRGVSPLSVSIAVGVQEMVPAERSFVAFTPGPPSTAATGA